MTKDNKNWEEEFDKLFIPMTVEYDEKVGKYRFPSTAIKTFISQLLSSQKKELLEDYTNWLCKKGYTDADVYAEEPPAIERYLSQLKKDE